MNAPNSNYLFTYLIIHLFIDRHIYSSLYISDCTPSYIDVWPYNCAVASLDGRSSAKQNPSSSPYFFFLLALSLFISLHSISLSLCLSLFPSTISVHFICILSFTVLWSDIYKTGDVSVVEFLACMRQLGKTGKHLICFSNGVSITPFIAKKQKLNIVLLFSSTPLHHISFSFLI